MTIIFIILLLGILWYFFHYKRSRIEVLTFPKSWHKILTQQVIYYKNLTQDGQIKFAKDVMRFLAGVRITGVQTEVSIEDKLLVASSAVIPVFAFPEWDYAFLDEVILYPTSFDRDFVIGSKKEFIQGMVGNGAMEGKMILSKRALHNGFSNDRDKKNVGLHEFIHLIDKQDGMIDGLANSLNDKCYSIPWLNLMAEKVAAMKSDNLGINPYGATNRQEFLAVAGEYFFERPHLLKTQHPQLYDLLSKAFKQDPTNVIQVRKKGKVEIGRNDPCPCGSGKKFKRCCMNA
jgi:Mlc titration factor MtfA (ptsG expression regulator)